MEVEGNDMTNAYVVTGTLTSATTVQLDEPLPITGGKVRVVLESTADAEAKPQQSLQDYLVQLRKQQAARGHVPRSAEEIQAQLREERDSWGD
jgi:hypothetical protein